MGEHVLVTEAVGAAARFSQRREVLLRPIRLASYAWVATLLLGVLVVLNVVLEPGQFAPSALGVTIGLAAPLVIAAMASTPPILAGGGGIDLSVGPFMGFVNALLVHELVGALGVGSAFVLVPVALALGIGSGLLIGVLVAVIRIQPIVATLGMYLVYGGLTLWIVPSPSGSVPGWLSSLAGNESFVPIVVVALVWLGLSRTPFYRQLMATGGDDRAAYASGVPVTPVRIGAYVVGGCFAGIGGISLTALLGSVDPNVGPTYTLTAIAAVALGGVSLAGGRGGLFGAVVGALNIYLIQDALGYFNVSPFVLQVVYGSILAAAVTLNAGMDLRLAGRLKGG